MKTLILQNKERIKKFETHYFILVVMYLSIDRFDYKFLFFLPFQQEETDIKREEILFIVISIYIVISIFNIGNKA